MVFLVGSFFSRRFLFGYFVNVLENSLFIMFISLHSQCAFFFQLRQFVNSAYTHVPTTYFAFCLRQRSLCSVERNSNKIDLTEGICSVNKQTRERKKNCGETEKKMPQNNSRRNEKSSGQNQHQTVF